MALSGKFLADFESFYAAVQKAETSLRSFESGAGKVETSLNRVSNGLSGTKIIQEAAIAAEAVDRIGGVSKLTEAELSRLSAQAKEAAAKMTAMGVDVPPGIQKIADAGKDAGGVFSNLTKEVKSTALGFVSAQAIIGAVQGSFRTLVGFVESSVDSYASAEAAAKKMTVALQAQGTAAPETIAAFNDLASSFQNTTVYSDDLINQMEALLTQVGDVAPSQMKKALSAATDLASGLGIDLQQATMLVGKAFAGETGTLSRYGIVIDQAKLKAEGMPAVLDAIQQKFGGQAQAELDTYSGKLKQIANDWDNIKESVGKQIIEDPILQALLRTTAQEVKKQSEAVDGADSSWQRWIQRLGDMVSPSQAAARQLEDLADVANTLAEATERMNRVPTPSLFSGDDFAAMDAKAKAFAQTIVDGWVKDDEAAKKYAATLDAAFKKWSGADLAEQAKILDITFRRMADSGQITEQQLRAMSAEAAKLAEQGAKLSPRLWDIVLATGELDPKLESDAAAFAKVGTAIDLVIPKVSAFDQAVVDLNAKIVWGFSGIPELGFRVSAGLDGVIDKTKKEVDQLGALATAFAQMAQVAGGTLGDVVRDFGTLVAATDTAKKSIDGIKSGFDKGGFSGILEATTGILGLASAAIAAGKAIASLFDRNKGRDLVLDFAGTFGGFDALHVKLNELGADGEQLWIALTQGVGRNNPEQARAAIEAVTAALEAQKTKTAEAAEAAAESGAKQAQAQQDALDAITAKYANTISKLDSEYKALNDSVSNEAEEAVMGVVETQQRARIEQIKAEKAAQEAMRDAEIEAKKFTFEQWTKDGQQTRDDLEQIFGKPLEIPYAFVPRNAPDGGGTRYVPSTSSGSGGATASVAIPIMLDGKAVGRGLVRVVPGLLTGAGR